MSPRIPSPPQSAPVFVPPPRRAAGSESIPIDGDTLRGEALQHLCLHGGGPPFPACTERSVKPRRCLEQNRTCKPPGFDLLWLPEGFPRRTRRQADVFDGGFARSRAPLGLFRPPLPPPSPGPVDALRVGGAICERWTELWMRR